MDTLIIFGAKYLIGVPLVVLVLYFILAKREVKYRLVWMSVFAMTFAYALARVAGDLYNNPRPFIVGHFKPLIEHAADNGFPSDHTLLAATLASVIFYFNKRMGVVLWAVTFVIAASRVFAGVHHVEDTLASMLIAIAAVFAAHFIVRAIRKEKKGISQLEQE
jgi:undecaprenyl-diphosphatase